MRYLVLLVALALAAVGYSVYWFSLAARVEAEAERWIGERAAEGYRITHEGYTVSGFPGRLVLRVAAPHIAEVKGPRTWEWSSERLTAHLQPWNLRHVIVLPGRTHTIEWREAGEPHSAVLSSRAARASLVFGADGRAERIAVDVEGAELIGGGLGAPGTVARLQVHTRLNPGGSGPTPQDTVLVAVEADGLRLPPELAGPLGREVRHLLVSADLPQPVPRSIADLEAWRENGGTVEIERIEVDWGPLALRGRGTAALDREMRPLGALSTEIQGFGATIEALVANGRMRASDATTAKLGLGLLAKPGPDGRPMLQVPVTAQDGRLFVGPVPVVRLAPVTSLLGRSPAR